MKAPRYQRPAYAWGEIGTELYSGSLQSERIYVMVTLEGWNREVLGSDAAWDTICPGKRGAPNRPRHFFFYFTIHQRTNILTYVLTSWSRVLLEKLTGFASSQEIPRIYGTRKFITIFTSARHLSLSWANSIHSPRPPTSWRSHLRLGLPNGLFPSGFPTRTLCNLSPPPCASHFPYIIDL